MISEKFREPICVCELGRLAGLEPSELSHLFKAEVGISPKQLLATLRFAYAAELLINTDHQIKGIAADAGLPVVDTFIRNFARICGLTPGEFRHMMQEIEANNGHTPPARNFPKPIAALRCPPQFLHF